MRESFTFAMPERLVVEVASENTKLEEERFVKNFLCPNTKFIPDASGQEYLLTVIIGAKHYTIGEKNCMSCYSDEPTSR